MIKRTIEISREPAHLMCRDDQLVVMRDGQRLNEASRFPCEDLGLVLVDHAQTTYTHSALAAIAAHGASLVICGRDHLPAAILLPVSGHTEVGARLRSQISASKPLRKRLWKQIVQAKVRQQAANLTRSPQAKARMHALAREVRSGDPTNVEAQAAKIYWSAWLDDPGFRRDPDAGGVNAQLNYAYAVLRAAIARSLVASGLHPALGIHHSNRSNAFALADDLIEPLRPAADARVRRLHQQRKFDLSQPVKAEILDLLTAPVETAGAVGPLNVGLRRYAASLAQCFEGAADRLEIPVFDPSCH